MLIQYFISFCCLIASSFHQTSHMVITQPSEQRLDQEVHIQIDQLSPFEENELQAKAKDQNGDLWTSIALFKADAQGQIDLASAQPLPGSSYRKMDPMGLFWSMHPENGSSLSSFKCKDDQFVVEIELATKKQSLIKQTITSFLKTQNVQRIDIKEAGLVGTLFMPKSEISLPLIITLSGSNGGLSETRAKLLASNGFAVLALGYFGVEGLPGNLENIPLEYFETAFKWLKKQPKIDSSHVGLYGVSRGGELALLLGAYFPESVQAIVAVVPSSVV